MAHRRMFSQAIVNSDAFLDMPASTQALYFQLGMRADDDGFVNPKMIMRLIGSSDDELKVLIGKKFVLPFENGVLVIKHWRINNFVRKDRYQPTLYSKEKQLLLVRDNQAYTFNDDGSAQPIHLVPWKNDAEMRAIPSGQPMVNRWSTQDRLGKDRLGKVNNDTPPSFDKFWSDYPKKVGKQDALKAWKKLNPNETLISEISSGLEAWKKSPQWTKDDGRFIPNPATFLNGRRWEDEVKVKKPSDGKYDSFKSIQV